MEMDTILDTSAFPRVEGFDPLSPEFLRDPVSAIRKAQDTAPVFYHEALKMWVITKHSDICMAARDFQTFSSQALGIVPPPEDMADSAPKGWEKEAFIAIDPPVHTHARMSVAQYFTPRELDKLAEPTRQIANELIDQFIDHGECDFMHDFAYPLSLRVIMQFLGIPTEHAADYRRWTDDLFSVFTPKSMIKPMSDEDRRKHWQGLTECFQFYEELTRDREENPRGDILTKMLQARDRDGNPAISRPAVVMHINEFVAAGNDTTSNLMAVMLQLLSEHPDQWEELKQTPDLMANAVEEALRIRGTSPGLFRITTKDVEIGGTTIPKGQIVWLLFVGGGLDPDKFDQPEKFDIHRANSKEHLAFGFGRHMCLGNPLARLEARIAMNELFRRIPGIRIVPGQDLEYLPTLTVLALKQLRVEWDPADTHQ